MNGQPFSARPQDLPVKADLARLRVCYVKDARLAYLGHLDLITTVERCVRRSGLPFSIGNGYARRMRIQFSGALPTGTSSLCELYDVRLTEHVDPEEAFERLRGATPGALAPTGVAYVPGRLPALEAWLDHATWMVTLAEGVDVSALLDGIARVREVGSVTYLRGDREKTVDVSSTLVRASAAVDGRGGPAIECETTSSGGASLRPQVLLKAAAELSGIPGNVVARVCRTRQWHMENDCLVEPLGPFGNDGPSPLS